MQRVEFEGCWIWALQLTEDTVNGGLGDGNSHDTRDDGGVGALIARED